MSVDSVQGSILYTPRRVQKCLFGSTKSSTKKNIQRIQNNLRIGDTLSEEESDLGPMSPLLLSPCTTPKQPSSSFKMYLTSNQSSPNGYKRNKTSLQQKILPDSSKALSNSPSKCSSLWTIERSKLTPLINKAASKTPNRHFGVELQNNITETPSKQESPEHRLITPLTSENKVIPFPKLHRRKSLSIFDTTKTSLFERNESTLKRHAFEELENTAKLVKTNVNCSVPKARAALFRDENCKTNLKDITLSTKTFYNNSNSDWKKNYRIINKSFEQKQQSNFMEHIHHNKKFMRRHTIGGINGGVFHGVRKPKPKVKLGTTKHNAINIVKDTVIDSVQKNIPETKDMGTPGKILREKSPTLEIDSNKRFFKIRRTSKKNSSATVMINNNVKLKVGSNDKMALNEENIQSVRQANKRAKLMDISFDTTDLTINDSELENDMIEENNITNILKMLENDWANDEYDTMEILTNQKFGHISPLKPVAILKDVAMSPASELSNLTSVMNIKDVNTAITLENVLLDNNKNNVKGNEQKYYPLFSKGYSANKIIDEIGKKSANSIKGNVNWQLSVKQNDEDQYQLDVGQTKFGAIQCAECGVVYQSGCPDDENAHLNYHNNRRTLKFPGWKTERVIMEDPITSSRVILIEPGDTKKSWNKIKDVLIYVDRDLGLVNTKLSDYEHKKVYLYIRDNVILGVLVAEHINTAHCMIPELLELDCCTAESVPAKCGINVIWTDMKYRRQGIASKLVDILRSQFYYGYILSLDDIAFSSPTVSGKIFAEKYTKTKNFKVYTSVCY
ncbi:N-acetyltransferase ESCO1 [Colletes gigas]|uniref:N-acetyltransferase ESCO1 n=1 Tax=Colletes gigas TaxID=935657 RepID=UPI001C9AAEF1|nr:N-acetyltransferase ESCO1 [Colletes gigas]XP_043251346.1 N-acetyltransferase ESCO1 [Colletes gigas]XP_043251347.1 N-acetyltransferase ESCO1 [Colletes gigas]